MSITAFSMRMAFFGHCNIWPGLLSDSFLSMNSNCPLTLTHTHANKQTNTQRNTAVTTKPYLHTANKDDERRILSDSKKQLQCVKWNWNWNVSWMTFEGKENFDGNLRSLNNFANVHLLKDQVDSHVHVCATYGPVPNCFSSADRIAVGWSTNCPTTAQTTYFLTGVVTTGTTLQQMIFLAH